MAQRASASSSVLPGEYRAAPIVFSPVGALSAGQVVGSAGSFDAYGFAATDQIQFQDRIYVNGPGGAGQGARYVVVDSVASLPNGGIVMQPTGVVLVEQVTPGHASTARVVEQFAPMRIGQQVLPLEPVPAATPAPSPVSEPVSSSVAWRAGEPALPGVLQWLVLETVPGASYSPGDRVELVRPAEMSEYGVMLPDEVLGSAIVIRTSAHGVTALLTTIAHGTISEGTAARRSARGR